MKKLVYLLLFVFLVEGCMSKNNTTKNKEDEFSDVNLVGGFSKDKILVILNKEVEFKEFMTSDFSELSYLKSVDELTFEMTKLAKKQLVGDFSLLEDHINQGMLIDTDNFRRILLLKFNISKLNEKNKEEFLNKTINILTERKDVAYAIPDFLWTVMFLLLFI
jgi:hypothetical protein